MSQESIPNPHQSVIRGLVSPLQGEGRGFEPVSAHQSGPEALLVCVTTRFGWG